MTEPKTSGSSFADLDGDIAARILADIGVGTEISKSKVKYGPMERAYRTAVEREFEAFREQHPKAWLDIPSDLPREDIDVEPYMKPPKAEGKQARPK